MSVGNQSSHGSTLPQPLPKREGGLRDDPTFRQSRPIPRIEPAGSHRPLADAAPQLRAPRSELVRNHGPPHLVAPAGRATSVAAGDCRRHSQRSSLPPRRSHRPGFAFGDAHGPGRWRADHFVPQPARLFAGHVVLGLQQNGPLPELRRDADVAQGSQRCAVSLVRLSIGPARVVSALRKGRT